MKQTIFTLFLLLLASVAVQAQNHPTCTATRYLTDSFAVDSAFNVLYGNNDTYAGNNQDLFMDIFSPANDVATQRPVVLLAFGGSFVGGERADVHDLCAYYASKGYVAVTIDYRIYDGGFIPLPDSNDLVDVVVKAIGDMKAAVRYLRQDAATSDLYKIDPNQIFVGGISAGAIVANHVAVLDSTDTIEAFLLTAIQNNGGWEGNSNSLSYSSEVQGSINFSGALRDANYIDANDPPIFSAHDDNDGTVPYGNGSARIASIPVLRLQGSQVMHQRMDTLGINNFLITIPNSNDHVSFFQGNAAMWRDSVLDTSTEFVHDILCPTVLPTQFVNNQSTIAVKVYPNPAQHNVTIDLGVTVANFEVTVFDNLGRIAYQQVVNNQFATVLPRAAFAKGMYHVRIDFEDQTLPAIATKVVFD